MEPGLDCGCDGDVEGVRRGEAEGEAWGAYDRVGAGVVGGAAFDGGGASGKRAANGRAGGRTHPPSAPTRHSPLASLSLSKAVWISYNLSLHTLGRHQYLFRF